MQAFFGFVVAFTIMLIARYSAESKKLDPEYEAAADSCVENFWQDPAPSKIRYLWLVREQLHFSRGWCIRAFLQETATHHPGLFSAEQHYEIGKWAQELARQRGGRPTFEQLDSAWMRWFASGDTQYRDWIINTAKKPLGSMHRKIHERYIHSAMLLRADPQKP